MSSVFLALWALCFLVAGATPAAASQEFSGRGVYYFGGSARCPLAGIGRRGADECNRIALDDGFSQVRVDREAHRIVWTNAHAYEGRRLVGDLMIVAIGTTAKGEHAPIGVHLKIEKKGDRFSASLHPHPTVREAIVSAAYQPFEVVLSNGSTETVALTADAILRAIREPELTARLANIFLQVNDHLDGKRVDLAQPGAHLVDLSIGIGVEKANLKFARIELLSLEPGNASLVRSGDLNEMFARGAWEMRITSMTPFLPREEFDREFFLLGLDHLALVQPVIEHGLKRGQSLVVGYHNGKGFLTYGGATAEIDNPVEVARAYMEFNFVGGLLARQMQTLPARPQ